MRPSACYRRHRPFASSADLRFAFDLTWLWLVSWIVPEGRWHGICHRMEWLKSCFGLFDLRSTAAAMARALDGIDPNAMALESAAGRSECHLQIMRSMCPGGWQPVIDLVGLHHLATATTEGRGCVLWVAHFCFNSLAVKIALARSGYRAWHVSRPEHGFSKSQVGIALLNPIRIAAERPHLAGRIVIDRDNPAGAMLAARRVLANGGIVSITAGAWEGIRPVEVNLLGGRLPLSMGAAGLSVLTGAPLLPVFTTRGAHPAIRVEIGAPISALPGSGREAATRTMAQCFADMTAARVRDYPAEWRDWKNLQPAAVRRA